MLDDIDASVVFSVALLKSVPLTATVALPVALKSGDNRANPTAGGLYRYAVNTLGKPRSVIPAGREG